MSCDSAIGQSGPADSAVSVVDNISTIYRPWLNIFKIRVYKNSLLRPITHSTTSPTMGEGILEDAEYNSCCACTIWSKSRECSIFDCGHCLLPTTALSYHRLACAIQMLLSILLQISLSTYAYGVSAKSSFQNHANITSMTGSDPPSISDNGEFKRLEWKFRYKPNV